MGYGELCETILSGATLHSGLPRRDRTAELAPKSGSVSRAKAAKRSAVG